MTSAMPAVPSGLPADLYHSAPILLVRYPRERNFGQTTIGEGLIVKALALAVLCATLAFFCSALRGRKLAPADEAAHAPVVQPAPKPTVVAAIPPHFSLPERPDRKLTEFLLTASSEFQSLGPVKLRLTEVDASNGSYNLAAKVRGRQFTRTNVKLDQAVKLGSGKKAAPEIVVGAIMQNRVWGYLSEPKAKAQSSHRRRKRR